MKHLKKLTMAALLATAALPALLARLQECLAEGRVGIRGGLLDGRGRKRGCLSRCGGGGVLEHRDGVEDGHANRT